MNFKRVRRVLSVVITGILMFGLVSCDIIKKSQKAIDSTVVAKVGNQEITRGELDKSMYYTLNNYRQEYGVNFEENADLKQTLKTERTKQLNILVANKMLLSMKNNLGIEYSNSEMKKKINAQIVALKKYCGDENSYISYIKNYGYTEKTFVKYLKEQYVLDLIKQKLVEDVSVSDDEISKYYNNNQNQYVLNPGAYVKHIVFKSETTGYKDACEARELVLQGKTFDEIAQMDKYKDNCKTEDLGHQDFDNNTALVSSFVNGFKNLPEGQVSEPIQTNYGWHLILTSKINKQKTVQSLDDVKAKIKETLLKQKQEEKYRQKIEKLQKKINIRIYTGKY